MNPTIQAPLAARRKVYCILSARSLPYAHGAVGSLLERSAEPLDLRLITDDESDRVAIVEALGQMVIPPQHHCQVHAQAEADDIAASRFAGLSHLREFRFGHPCWRKITDPLLFAEPGEEMVILDPDLYFPNHFRFEPTPAEGIALMWQRPSCLLPHETVMAAYGAGIALAHHVDIGVAQARHNIDLAWLDTLIARLGGKALPRAMHVEAIVWAALAMRVGGGYLDPTHWHCWQNTQWKRVAQALRVPGPALLRMEDFTAMKCFHGGGAAKWWIAPAVASGQIGPAGEQLSAVPLRPFEELAQAEYLRSQRVKTVARKLGYYRLMAR
jgi:hypothetical protein